MQLLDTLAAIPGLGIFILLSGILMIGIDVRKLYKIAIERPEHPDYRFYYILPGITFFTIGFFTAIR